MTDDKIKRLEQYEEMCPTESHSDTVKWLCKELREAWNTKASLFELIRNIKRYEKERDQLREELAEKNAVLKKYIGVSAGDEARTDESVG